MNELKSSSDQNTWSFETESEKLLRIRKEFSAPFTEQEIEHVVGIFEENSNGRFTLLQRDFDNSSSYRIFLDHLDNSDSISFHWRFPDYTGNDALLDFVGYPDGNGKWHISHRYVRTGDSGVSGTEFLQQAENFLILLKEKGLIDLNKVYCVARQESVIDWLLKNGFEIPKSEEKNKYQHFKERREQYIMRDHTDEGDDYGKSLYIHEKATNKELIVYLEKTY